MNAWASVLVIDATDPHSGKAGTVLSADLAGDKITVRLDAGYEVAVFKQAQLRVL